MTIRLDPEGGFPSLVVVKRQDQAEASVYKVVVERLKVEISPFLIRSRTY